MIARLAAALGLSDSSPLVSRSHVERNEALANRRRELDVQLAAAVAEHEAAIARARDTHRTRTAEAEAIPPARTVELDAELAASIREALFPLVARFDAEPRRVAVELVEVWNKHAAEVRLALGEEPSPYVIFAAFLHAAGGDEAVARLGSPDFRLHRRLTGGDHYDGAFGSVGPAEKERLFRVLEADLAAGLGWPLTPDAERAECMLAHAGNRRRMLALDEFDARRRADEQAASIAARAAYEQSPEHQAWRAEKERTLEQMASKSGAGRSVTYERQGGLPMSWIAGK